MTTRTTNRRVTFFRPFKLTGMDGEHPAGSYMVETDEELMEGLSLPVYRRTATYIVLPGRPGSVIASETLGIAPQELQAALSSALEAATTRPAGAPRTELTLDDLLAERTVQTAISSTPFTLAGFKTWMRDLIDRRPDEPVRRPDAGKKILGMTCH